MNVIGHQAVGPVGEAVAFGVLAQETEIGTTVVAGVKRVRAPVSPLGDVVGKPRYDDTCDAAHGGEDRQDGMKRRVNS